MKDLITLFAFLFFGKIAFGQTDTFNVRGISFLSITQIVNNDFDTKDTLLKLYGLKMAYPDIY